VKAWFGGTLSAFATFEGLEDTVKRLNTTLETDPIPGMILCFLLLLLSMMRMFSLF